MNILVCGVCCDPELALEIKKRTFEIGGKTVPFDTMEIMATSSDYAENAPDLQREAQAHYQKIREEIENFYKPDKTEAEAAVHPTFAEYITDLKAVYEDACNKYDRIFSSVEDARRIWKDAKGTPGLSELNLVRAKEAYLTAEQAFKDSMSELKKEVDEKTNAIRGQLKMHAQAFYMASADKLDDNVITLLESGILTDNELESLSRKYRSNVTMMRMVGRYAGMRNTDTMRSLTYKIEHLGLNGEAELKIFDNAKVVGNRTIDPRDRTLVKVGRKHFDQGMQEAIDEMNGLIVQPMA